MVAGVHAALRRVSRRTLAAGQTCLGKTFQWAGRKKIQCNVDQDTTGQTGRCTDQLRGWPPGWHSWTSELDDMLMTGEV